MKKQTVSAKKEIKENKLLDSAYTLFVHNGFSQTSIDDIVKKAEVAKGTFYLYFSDKDDLLEHLAARTSSQFIARAFEKTRKADLPSFTERSHCFINALIDDFKAHKGVLRLLRHSFTWPMASKELNLMHNDELELLFSEFMNNCPFLKTHTKQEGKQLLYLIVEMIGTACYSAIIKSEPAPIEEMRPMILSIADRMLS